MNDLATDQLDPLDHPHQSQAAPPCRRSSDSEGSNPRPSSRTISSRPPLCFRSSTLKRVARACLAVFVSASWTTRKQAVSISGAVELLRRR